MASKAIIALRLSSHRMADSIAKSIKPELGQTGNKARVKLRVTGKCLELKFHARDTTTLRAIVNSYLRMISACMRAITTIDKLKT